MKIYLDNCCYNRPYDDHFDYTKWREDKFDDMSLEELNNTAAEYSRNHPFKGSGTIL